MQVATKGAVVIRHTYLSFEEKQAHILIGPIAQILFTIYQECNVKTLDRVSN